MRPTNAAPAISRFLVVIFLLTQIKKMWQTYSVAELRHLVRRLRKHAICCRLHLFNTRRTKQDLVALLRSLWSYQWNDKGKLCWYHKHLAGVELYWFPGYGFFFDSKLELPV